MAQNKLIETDEIENTEIVSGDLSRDDLREIAEAIENSAIGVNQDDNGSFYKGIVNHLMETEGDVSSKTEYLNVSENFAGAKLDYLGKYGGMPFVGQFVNIFEKKRISLQRKGRKELIMALQEKQRQEAREEQNKLMNMFGM